MSIEHMAMVFAADGIPGKARLLLLAYTNRCDDHGFCWPGEDRLVAETGMSASTVRRAKKDLIDAGLVKSVRRPDTSNMTRINLKLLASMRRPDRDYDDNLMQKFGFAEDAQTGAAQPSDLRTVQDDLTVRSSCSDGQVILTSGPGQDDLETLSEPSEKPPSPSVPQSPSSQGGRGGGGGGDASQQQKDQSPAGAFVDALPYRGRVPGPKQRAYLVAATRAALTSGWPEGALRQQLTADTESAKSMAAVYRYRLDPENLPAPPVLALLPDQRSVPARPCCPECQRPLATGSETVLCRDCRNDA